MIDAFLQGEESRDENNSIAEACKELNGLIYSLNQGDCRKWTIFLYKTALKCGRPSLIRFESQLTALKLPINRLFRTLAGLKQAETHACEKRDFAGPSQYRSLEKIHQELMQIEAAVECVLIKLDMCTDYLQEALQQLEVEGAEF